MKPSEALAIHRVALRRLLNRYGFASPRVFGSVLTKTDTEESDLDVLVESVLGTTLFTLVAAEDEAQQLTGVRVSVLTPGFLPPKFRDKVLQQAEPHPRRRVPYRRMNHAISETTALTISIVVIGKKNLNPGRSMTMSPGR